MIKSVSIQNFEAHEDTTIHFTDGMNSIVGLSNSGKSAIIRALMVVVDNEWSKEMVRTGYEFCRVKVETERGWVEAERGEKVNRWRCKEGDNEIQLFQKVGTSVPELATKILGMGKRERGNGISELPNFQTQLEKHYMLAEIGDKKATSNMIAVMMDNAIGLGGMEDLIKDFSADLLKDRKWLNEKQQEIVDLKSGIIDESIFSQYQKDVARIGELHEAVGSIDSDISTADGYLGKVGDCKDRLDVARKRLESIPDVQVLMDVSEDVETLDGGIAIVQKALGVEESLATATKLSGIDADSMYNVSGRYESLCRTINACEKIVAMEDALSVAKQMAGIDSDALERLQKEVDAMDDGVSVAESRLFSARDAWKRHSVAKKEANSLAAELAGAENEFEKLKKELGVCPLCGGKL
jgi:DNA repair ATPase RecN